jgi:hypothetical protein
MLVKNALAYTVDSRFTTADTFVGSARKIVAIGKAATWKKRKKEA